MSAADSKDDDLSGRALSPKLMRRLLAQAKPHRRGFYMSTALLLLLCVLTLVVPKIVGSAIDANISSESAALLSNEERTWGLVSTAAIIIALGVVTFVVRFIQVMLTNRTGQRVIHDLRLGVFGHITRRDIRYFDRNPVGSLVTRVTSDIETLNEFFVSGIDVLLYDFLRIFVIAGILLVIDWRMAIVTLGCIPFVLGWAFYFQRRARKLFRNVRKDVSALNSFLNESLSGARVIRWFRREGTVSRRFFEKDRTLRDAHVATVWNFSWFFPGLEFLPSMGTALLLVVGYHRVTSNAMQLGDLFAFWFYLGIFIEPLRQIADKYNILQAAVAAGERVFRVLDDPSALKIAETPKRIGNARGAVRFENVVFSYVEGQKVLKGIDLDVPAGARFAVVGPTGSGKSTLISLLCRFYDPDQGRILLDGIDLRELDPYELRRRIGVVLQDVFLFDGSVRENLTLGDPQITDEQVWRAAEAVQADQVIKRLGGLDGRILERGATLSTGEKQLLAFARTMAYDPALLVLDEATAHIDTETEVALKNAVGRLMVGRTAIVIAHRLSTIQESDRIIVLHHGEIREAGRHDELLANGGIYARLHRLQFARAGVA